MNNIPRWAKWIVFINHNRDEPFAAMLWALSIVLAYTWPCPPALHHSYRCTGSITMLGHDWFNSEDTLLYGWNWIIGIFNILLFILPLPYKFSFSVYHIYPCFPVCYLSLTPPPLAGSQRGVKRWTGPGPALPPPSLIHMTTKQLGI